MNGIQGSRSRARLTGFVGIGGILMGVLGVACGGGDASSSEGQPAAAGPVPAAPVADPAPPASSGGSSGGGVADSGAPKPPPPAPDAAPPVLAPQTLGARLALWLRADQGVQGPANGVTGWKDQSSHGNDAVAMGATAVTATAAGINGHPTMHFDGGGGYLNVADSASLQLGTDDVTAYAVVAHKSALSSASRMIFSKQAAPYPYTGFGMYVNYASTYGVGAILQYNGPAAVAASDVPETYSNEKPLLVWAQRSGADSLTVDVGATHISASSLINGAAVDLSSPAALRIGGQGNLGQALDGDIAELILVKGTMTPAETQSVVTYLGAKYAL